MSGNNKLAGLFFLAALAMLLVPGCGSHSPGPGSTTIADTSTTSRAATSTAGSATSANGQANGMTRSVIRYAHGFRIDYYDHYRDVSILNRNGGRTDTLHYLLVDQGVARPAGRP